MIFASLSFELPQLFSACSNLNRGRAVHGIFPEFAGSLSNQFAEPVLETFKDKVYLNKEISKYFHAEGRSLALGEIVVSGEKALEISEALNSASLRILQLLLKERLDVSTIAERLEMSEAYVSEQIQTLERLGLIRANYERGRRGVRKVCETVVKKITIVIEP